jgi:hypothetical protein
LPAALATAELIASTKAAPAPKSRRIFIVTSPKVLRSTDAESLKRIVMVHSAPITPTANSFEHQRSTDTCDNQPDAHGDLLCQRPQGIEKRHQKAINPQRN